MRDFFASVGMDKPAVAGNSLGGLLSLRLACRGTVRSAIAIAPPAFSTPLGNLLMAAVIVPGLVALRLPGGYRAQRRFPRLRALTARLVARKPLTDTGAILANVGAIRRRYAVLADRLLPAARQVVLPGCGHTPMIDAPDLVADLLLTIDA